MALALVPALSFSPKLKRFLRDLGITGPSGEHLPYWDQISYTRFLFDFWARPNETGGKAHPPKTKDPLHEKHAEAMRALTLGMATGGQTPAQEEELLALKKYGVLQSAVANLLFCVCLCSCGADADGRCSRKQRAGARGASGEGVCRRCDREQ